MIHVNNHVIFAMSIVKTWIREIEPINPLDMDVIFHSAMIDQREMRWIGTEEIMQVCHCWNHVPVVQFDPHIFRAFGVYGSCATGLLAKKKMLTLVD